MARFSHEDWVKASNDVSTLFHAARAVKGLIESMLPGPDLETTDPALMDLERAAWTADKDRWVIAVCFQVMTMDTKLRGFGPDDIIEMYIRGIEDSRRDPTCKSCSTKISDTNPPLMQYHMPVACLSCLSAMVERMRNGMPGQRLLTQRELSKLGKSGKEGYAAYCQTDHFGNVKRRVYDRDGHACMFDRSHTPPFNVHHRSYENLGDINREVEDCIVLCRACHAKHHNKLTSWNGGKK